MNPSSPLAALGLALFAPAFALAQGAEGFPPLAALPDREPPPAPLKERLFARVRAATRPLPHLRRLVLPTRGVLNLRVVPVSFADEPPPAFGAAAFDAALFSRGVYRRTASGDPAAGSMRDYFLEASGGALDLRGRSFDWIALPTRRAELAGRPLVDPTARQSLFGAALDRLLAREGPDALLGVDALVFVVAGPQAATRGEVTWPHSGVLFHRGRAWRYYLMHAGRRFQPIGTHCHEMGHVLGVLDKYGLGAHTGVGQWCLMASGGGGARTAGPPLDAPPVAPRAKAEELLREQLEKARRWIERALGQGQRERPRTANGPRRPRRPRRSRGAGSQSPDRNRTRIPARPRFPSPRRPGARLPQRARPLHPCAVCKVRLGWSRPKVVDPREGARFALTPVEEDPNQVAVVLLDPHGRERLVLEYRGRRGFDADLPRSGLLVWRTGSPTAFWRTFVPVERVELLPAHGVRSVDAPHRAPKLVPFPAGGHHELVVPSAWGEVVLSELAERDGRFTVRVRLR